MSDIAPMRHAAHTHPGRRRPINEDAFGIDSDLHLFVVADGMGGHDAGEVASNIVVEAITAAVRRGESLAAAVRSAHRAVLQAVQDGIGRPGMGATVVCAQFEHNDFEIAWAGDSRAYRFGKRLQRLSRDHSLVQDLVDGGELTEAEARTHPDRSLVTRALGMPDVSELEVDSVSGTLPAGHRLLLCSDGLTEELDDEAIQACLRACAGPEKAVKALIQAALDAGGRDNITVAVVDAPAGSARLYQSGETWLAAILALVAAALAGWLFWSYL